MKTKVDRYNSRVLEEYTEDLYGIPVVIRDAVIEHMDRETNEVFVEIPDEEELEIAMAVARAFLPISLSGSELKFLRKTCNMNSRDFSAYIGVKPETYSRWERNAQGIGHHSEMTIRMKVLGALYERAPAIDVSFKDLAKLEILKRTDSQEMPVMKFSRVAMKHDRKLSEQWGYLEAAA